MTNNDDHGVAEQTGEIIAVENCGTIIAVVMKNNLGRVVPVYFDHRPFAWLLQGEQMTVEQLIGRTAGYDGECLRFIE